jgi:hypothetical protein
MFDGAFKTRCVSNPVSSEPSAQPGFRGLKMDPGLFEVVWQALD